MLTIPTLAKKYGMRNLVCEQCGHYIKLNDLFKHLFDKIMEACADGESVRVSGFGTFRPRVLKGRQVNSPIIDGGTSSFEDVVLIKFKQHRTSKRAVAERIEQRSKPSAQTHRKK
jgi:nucleoid DNA-binding protein